MRLRDARLCLDCDDVHETSVCPVCGSESFTYISRWVPVPEHERSPQLSNDQAETYRELLGERQAPQGGRRFLRGGLLGLTALGLAGWAWRSSRTEAKDSTESS